MLIIYKPLSLTNAQNLRDAFAYISLNLSADVLYMITQPYNNSDCTLNLSLKNTELVPQVCLNVLMEMNIKQFALD